MARMRKVLLLIAVALPSAASGQQPPLDPRPSVVVNGSGRVETLPDIAVISFDLRGEGVTPDDATRAMVDKRKRVQDAVAGLLGRQMRWTTGELRLGEVRGRQCEGNGYNPPRLSTDSCAVIGYLASLRVTVRTTDRDRAGTAVGLIGRQGGGFVRIERWELADPAVAQRAATAKAATNAREQAEALAVASGGRLGAVLRVQDGYGERASLAMARDVGDLPSASPPPAPPPIEVALAPHPIETSANVTMTFELLR